MANSIPDDIFKRLVLANQYRILSLLDSDSADHWARASEKVIEGWPVDSLPDYEMITDYARDPLTKEEQHFVLDALNVFELIQDGLEAGMKPARDHAVTEFLGFDGNSETKLMSYARHVVEHEGRFESVRRSAKDFNSHMPTVAMYRRMIDAWKQHDRPFRIDPKLFDDLIAAQPHPSRR